MSYFSIRNCPGTCLTAMRKCVSGKRTRVVRLTRATRQSMKQFRHIFLSEKLFIRELSRLTHAAPCWVSVLGIVARLKDETQSQNGSPMRSFMLCDPTGKYVPCTCLGRHVDNQHLVENNEIIIYFADAKLPNTANLPGQLWLYDESHIGLSRSQCNAPTLRSLVDLRPPP